jgi:hypothetical protein
MKCMNKGIVVVGTNSKISSFICKYPFRAMFIIIILAEILGFLVGGDSAQLYRGTMALLTVSLSIISIMYLISDKWCYRVEINTLDNLIRFYRLCNKPLSSFKLEKIRIIIGAYCHILIKDSKFILHAHYIHDFVSLLPKDTIIEYKGYIGKYKEKHWAKGPPIPGG